MDFARCAGMIRESGDMENEGRSIALVLDERLVSSPQTGASIDAAMELLRTPDGAIRLRPVSSVEEFDRLAQTTGCFRRGTPIRDPGSREIIGYELEEVPLVRRRRYG